MSTPLQEAVAEVVAAVAPPLTIAVAVLSIIFLGFSWTNLVQLLVGALFTTAGLFLFLRGTRIALLPMGEMIGAYLPKHGSMALWWPHPSSSPSVSLSQTFSARTGITGCILP